MYTDINSGDTVGAANNSSSTIEMDSNVLLNWSSDSNNAQNPMTSFLNLIVSEANLSIFLPDATLASPGSYSIFVNQGPNAVNIKDFDGNLILAFANSETVMLKLDRNIIPRGSWQVFSNPTGSSVVTGVAATPPTRGIAISGSPISGGSGTFVLTLTNTLSSLENIGTGSTPGYLIKTADGTLVLRSIVSSDTNIIITNISGLAGNTALSLNTNLTGFTSAVIGHLTLSANTIASSNANPFYLNSNGQGVKTDTSFSIIDSTTNFISGLYLTTNSITSNILYKLPTAIPSRIGSLLTTSPIDGTHASIAPSKYNQSGASAAWVQFNGTSFAFFGNNIASCVQNVGTGSFTVTFTNAFSSTVIGCLGQCGPLSGAYNGFMTFQIISSTTVNIFTRAGATGVTPTNYEYNFASFFGTLA